MIKLITFYPFANFLRVTNEFYEDKIIVKSKSPTFERESEIYYEELGQISDTFHVSSGQMTFGFWLLVFTGYAFGFFCNVIYSSSLLLAGVQTLYTCGAILFFTGFIKSWHIVLSDKDDNILTRIKLTRKNRDLVLQAIEMIKSKSKNIREITSANPFREAKHVFEHEYYDFSELEKTTDRFYEDEIIGLEKSLLLEKAYTIKYNLLNGKIYKGKVGNDSSGWVFALTLFVLSILFALYRGFDFLPTIVFECVFYIFLFILVLSWFLKFIKRQIIGLYDQNGTVIYWMYVNRAEQSKVDQIINYIQSKIHAENKI